MNRHLKEFLRKAMAIVAMAAVLGAPQLAWATPITLAGWDFNGYSNYGASPATPSTTASNLTVVGLTRGANVGTSGTAATNAWGGTSWDGKSLTFSFTADSGYSMSFDSFANYNVRRSSSGATSGQWQYQVGSGEFTNIGSAITWGSGTSGSGNAQSSISLSGISALQNVSAGSTVTFRLNLAGGTTGTWYLNNFQTGNDFSVLGTVMASGGGGGDSNYYWVGADTTRGGDGTWAGSGGTAWATTDEDVAGTPWDSSKTANFGGTSGTVTVSGGVNADAGITFGTTGYTVSGGTLTLGGDAATNAIVTGADISATIASAITASNGLTKSGAGTLTLSGSNALGGTTVSGGTLIGTTSSLTGNITNNAAVVFDQATDGEYAGAMTGTGSLTKLGAGNVTLSGANTFAGGTTVSAGTLTAGNGATAGGIAVAGSLDLAATTTLAFDRSDTVSFTGTVAGAGTLAQVGSGTLTLSRSTAYGSEFTLRVENGTVDLNRSGSTLVGILGAGNTVELAGGTLQLTSNSGGETKFENAAIDVEASSTLLINRTGTAANHTTDGFSAPITVSNGATLAFDYAGVIGSGFKGTTTYSAPVTLASNATFSVANSAGGTAEVIFSGAVGDGGAGYGLTKTGPERLTLSGTNTYSGGTTVNAGTLSVAADAALGDTAGGITLGGGTLEMTSSFTLGSDRTITAAAATNSTLAVTTGTVSFAGAFTGSGGLDKAGEGRLVVSNASSEYTGLFTVSAGTLEVTGSNAFANAALSQTGGTLLLAPAGGGDVTIPDLDGSSGTTTVADGVTAVVGGPGNSNYNGRVRGQGGLRKEGAGELQLNGDNDFAGNTRIAAGRLKLGANGSLSATPLIEIDSGAIFDVADKTGGFALGNGQRLGGRGTILGDLEFGAGSEIAFDPTGPMLVGDGGISFAAGFGIGSIAGLDSSVAEGTYTLLDEISGGSISFANLTNVGPGNPFILGDGKSAYFQQGSLQVVVVPEPSPFLLGGLGFALAGLLITNRRRQRTATA